MKELNIIKSITLKNKTVVILILLVLTSIVLGVLYVNYPPATNPGFLKQEENMQAYEDLNFKKININTTPILQQLFYGEKISLEIPKEWSNINLAGKNIIPDTGDKETVFGSNSFEKEDDRNATFSVRLDDGNFPVESYETLENKKEIGNKRTIYKSYPFYANGVSPIYVINAVLIDYPVQINGKKYYLRADCTSSINYKENLDKICDRVIGSIDFKVD